MCVFIRWAEDDGIHEDILFYKPLETTGRGVDIFNKLKENLNKFNLNLNNCIGVCTDGAPSMTGRHNGLYSYILKESENSIMTHCMIHKTALASKNLPAFFQKILENNTEIVKFFF